MKSNAVHCLEFLTQQLCICTQALIFCAHLGVRDLCRTPTSDNCRRILRPGTQIPLLCTAANERHNLRSTAQVERTDALRSTEFMRGKGECIHVQYINIEGYMSRGLYGICMKWNPARTDNGSDLRNRLDGANLVIRRHNADEHRIRTQRRLYGGRINAPLPVNRDFGHREPARFEMAAALTNGRMFNC